MCFFDVWLYSGADVEALEGMSQAFKSKLEEFTGKNFDEGVVMEDLVKVEECFNIGLNVYALDDKKIAKLIRLTERNFDICAI